MPSDLELDIELFNEIRQELLEEEAILALDAGSDGFDPNDIPDEIQSECTPCPSCSSPLTVRVIGSWTPLGKLKHIVVGL